MAPARPHKQILRRYISALEMEMDMEMATRRHMPRSEGIRLASLTCPRRKVNLCNSTWRGRGRGREQLDVVCLADSSADAQIASHRSANAAL